jgi:hypothetical protein
MQQLIFKVPVPIKLISLLTYTTTTTINRQFLILVTNRSKDTRGLKPINFNRDSIVGVVTVKKKLKQTTKPFIIPYNVARSTL